MPWTHTTPMDQRLEFVTLASAPGANISALCRRFGISRDVGYKWLGRWTREGERGLQDRSRRPHTSPNRTPPPVEAAVCAVRRAHPAWGGRKIRAALLRQLTTGTGPVAAAVLAPVSAEAVPAASTCTRILARHGLLAPPSEQPPAAWTRFEKERPNQLWQMDFKGDLALQNGQRCYPLTVVDDHSRYAVVLAACPDQTQETVQQALTAAFQRYGRPERIITDHGAPWGVGMRRSDGLGGRTRSYYTAFSVWLMRLGIQVSFTARAHPQTNGKNERFNQTVGVEVLTPGQHAAPGTGPLVDRARCQARFDAWRQTYNGVRPHQRRAPPRGARSGRARRPVSDLGAGDAGVPPGGDLRPRGCGTHRLRRGQDQLQGAALPRWEGLCRAAGGATGAPGRAAARGGGLGGVLRRAADPDPSSAR